MLSRAGSVRPREGAHGAVGAGSAALSLGRAPLAVVLLAGGLWSIAAMPGLAHPAAAETLCSSYDQGRYPNVIVFYARSTADVQNVGSLLICTDAAQVNTSIHNFGSAAWRVTKRDGTPVPIDYSDSGVLRLQVFEATTAALGISNAQAPHSTVVYSLPPSSISMAVDTQLTGTWDLANRLRTYVQKKAVSAVTARLGEEGSWSRALVSCGKALYSGYDFVRNAGSLEGFQRVSTALTTGAAGAGCVRDWDAAKQLDLGELPSMAEKAERLGQNSKLADTISNVLERVGKYVGEFHAR